MTGEFEKTSARASTPYGQPETRKHRARNS
jgi:hypothetical protein